MIIDDEKNRHEENYSRSKVRFKIYGVEVIEKIVKSCGTNGRVYLPQRWIGSKVKVVKC